MGTDFYGSNDPTNSVKALKEDMILRIRLQSHQVRPTVLRIIQHLCRKKTQNTHRYREIHLHTVKWAQCDKTQSREL